MSFRTPNSSFILLRLLLSIIECAVFRAIFRPAALVADGCLRFVPAAWVGFAGVTADEAGSEDEDEVEPVFGFIWMIFLALLGGGGRSNCIASSRLCEPESVRFLGGLDIFGLCPGDTGGDILVTPLWSIAAGGRTNDCSTSV
jgi:hypothetical protein